MGFSAATHLERFLVQSGPENVSKGAGAARALQNRRCVHKAMRGWVLLSRVKRYEMSAMSKEQIKRDERSLIIFLILFNIALVGAFLLACFYQR
jgi:hypothetical protein